jgi:hypothetical protein
MNKWSLTLVALWMFVCTGVVIILTALLLRAAGA